MLGFREQALKLVTDNGYKTVAELGVWEGALSKLLYEVVDKLILVDPWSVHWNSFDREDGTPYECTMGVPYKNQAELDKMYDDVRESMPNALVFRVSSIIAAKSIPDKSIDFAFLDSVHTYEYCKKEIRAWIRKIRPGGMIAGDDYYKPHNEVSKAVDELLGPKDTDRVWSHKVC